MYYVARRQHPAPAPHPAPRARRQPLRRGAVRRRGVHRPELAALPPRRRRRGRTRSSRSAADQARGRRRRPPSPPADEDRRRRAEGRRRSPAGSRCTSTTTSSSASSGPPRRCPTDSSTATAIADEMLFVHEGTRRLRHDLRRPPLRPRRLPRPADRDDLAARPGRGLGPADPVPRGAVRDRAAEALPQRLRPAARALAVLASATSTPPSSASRATSTATSSSTSARATGSPPTTTGTTRSTSSAGTATCGRSGSTSPTSSRSPGRVHQPPPVHQTFQARNFVVCSFVPRKFDYHPLAIPAPYNHSNINSDEVIYYVAGNFMSRRGVEIASFTLHPAGHPARPAPGHGRGVDRQGGDRGAGGHGRHVPSAARHEGGDGPRRRRTTRTRGCRPRTPRRKPPSSRSEARRRSRTDLGRCPEHGRRVLGEVTSRTMRRAIPKSTSPRVRARMANASRSPRWACSTRSRSTRSALSVARIGCAVRAYRVITSRECSNFASILGAARTTTAPGPAHGRARSRAPYPGWTQPLSSQSGAITVETSAQPTRPSSGRRPRIGCTPSPGHRRWSMTTPASTQGVPRSVLRKYARPR